MFQTKDFVSVVAGALNHLRGSTDKITDFQVGSVARTLIEGPAVEIEQLYQQMFIGLREAIPVATFLSFGFDLLPAARAIGTVTVTRAVPGSAPITIPAGTVFTAADSRKYTSTAEVIWAAISLVAYVPVQSDSVGVAGNISAGAITGSTLFAAPIVVSNLPITSGRDAESDAEREVRFAAFIASLSRGTLVAIKYAASQAVVLGVTGTVDEYVTRTGLVEQSGRVRVYIHSSNGTPSAALIANGQARIDGYVDAGTGVVVPGFRSAGVRVDVLAMVEHSVTSTISVAMLPGYTLTTAVVNALTDEFHTVVGSVESGNTLYIGTLVERLLTVPGVRQVVPSNDSNIICAENEILVPGVLTVVPLNV